MLETTDAVLALDRLQNTDDAITCHRNVKHGKLWVHKSGSVLVCGEKDCSFNMPVSKEMLDVASRLG